MALYLSLALLSYPLLFSSPKAFVAIHGGVGAGFGLSGRLVTVRFYCKIKFAFRTAKPSRRIRDTMARPKKKSKNRETGSEWLSLFLAPFPTVLFSLQLSIISRTEFPRETKFSTPSARYKKKTSSA